MAAWYGYSPAMVDPLSLRDVVVMLEGARRRREDAWMMNSRLCSLIENTAFGKKGKPSSAEDYMPASILPKQPNAANDEDAEERWKRAIAQDRAATDRRNAERAKRGLPPLPYKEI